MNIGAERLATQSDALNKLEISQERKTEVLRQLKYALNDVNRLKYIIRCLKYAHAILEQENEHFNDTELNVHLKEVNDIVACVAQMQTVNSARRIQQLKDYVDGLEVK